MTAPERQEIVDHQMNYYGSAQRPVSSVHQMKLQLLLESALYAFDLVSFFQTVLSKGNGR